MNDQSWLQFCVLLLIVIWYLDRLSLYTSDSHIFILDEAVGYQTDGEVGLVINTVQLDRLKLVFEQILCLNDESFE